MSKKGKSKQKKLTRKVKHTPNELSPTTQKLSNEALAALQGGWQQPHHISKLERKDF